MPNVLQNQLQTSGLNGQQPWKAFYKGIKPSNPLGGNIVRRMGNKVKGVVPATNTKNMTFAYMGQLADFRADPGYVPPYKPLAPNVAQTYTYPTPPQTSPPYYYSQTSGEGDPTQAPGMSDREMYRRRREQERSGREQSRDSRRAVADTRANYRTLLDTARETRGWANTLGIN